MRYRKACALYDEVNIGNPGNVPWCSDKGLEPDCENCTRPDKTNADRIRMMSNEELATAFIAIAAQKRPSTYTAEGFCLDDGEMSETDWLSWLKAPVEVDNGT